MTKKMPKKMSMRRKRLASVLSHRRRMGKRKR